MKICPCHSGKLYIECCGLYISGKQLPQTPEQLMRSRYSAYATANIDYISRTMRGPARKNFSKREAEQWARQLEWLGLEIRTTSLKDDTGFVEFIARYSNQGIAGELHEHSEFQLKNGKWYYIRGISDRK